MLNKIIFIVIHCQPEDTDTTPRSPAVVFNITGGSFEHGMDGNDEVLLHLAGIQN